MSETEWKEFFAGVKERSAKFKAELKARPDVKVCDKCDAPQLPQHKCTRCKGQACFGYGDLCCSCTDIEAEEFWKAHPLIERDETIGPKQIEVKFYDHS